MSWPRVIPRGHTKHWKSWTRRVVPWGYVKCSSTWPWRVGHSNNSQSREERSRPLEQESAPGGSLPQEMDSVDTFPYHRQTGFIQKIGKYLYLLLPGYWMRPFPEELLLTGLALSQNHTLSSLEGCSVKSSKIL